MVNLGSVVTCTAKPRFLLAAGAYLGPRSHRALMLFLSTIFMIVKTVDRFAIVNFGAFLGFSCGCIGSIILLGAVLGDEFRLVEYVTEVFLTALLYL